MTTAAAQRLLIVGSMPPPLGGTTVSLDALATFAKARGRDVRIVDSNAARGGLARSTLRTLRDVLLNLSWCDVVSLHFGNRATVTIAPLLVGICWIARKPVIFRQFGGSLPETVKKLPRPARWMLRHSVFSADAVLLQTKAMVAAFASWSPRIRWFPTARRRPSLTCTLAFATGRRKMLQCLFIGRVSRNKGVTFASRILAGVNGTRLTVYGPLDDLSEADFVNENVTYGGILSPDDVPAVMADHDLLVFPSVHPGEGYSGTLVEASLVGLPIMAGRWRALPEMFEDDEVIFLSPRDGAAWTAAIAAIRDRPDTLAELSARLLRRSADFDAETVFGNFLRLCDSVALGRGVDRCAA